MVREFKLVNEKGEEYSLMDIENNCLMTNIVGLGISYITQYEQVGNSYIENNRKIDQGKPSGTVNFKSYENYRNFANFIVTAEKLKLKYKVPYKDGTKEYLRDIKIQNIEKTEMKPTGIISEPIIFETLSLWYEENSIKYKIEKSMKEIRWNFRWNSRFKNYNIRNISYKNMGHVEAPIEVELSGAVINPKIEIYINKELYQVVPIKVSVGLGEKLLYGSKENDFYINMIKSDGTKESLFNLNTINFENDNVIRLPVGRECEIQISADNTILDGNLTIFPQYYLV